MYPNEFRREGVNFIPVSQDSVDSTLTGIHHFDNEPFGLKF
jgi:hypothetical protein